MDLSSCPTLPIKPSRSKRICSFAASALRAPRYPTPLITTGEGKEALEHWETFLLADDNRRKTREILLASCPRWNDVLRFVGPEVVVGLYNLCHAIRHWGVNPCPFPAWRQPGLPLANQSHCAQWNIC